MFIKSFFNFSKQTKRNLVPKILRDPKFTRTGISKKKAFKPDYNLENIENAELYHQPVKSEWHKVGLFPPKSLKEAQEQLLDPFRLNRGSRSLINTINYIEKNHQDQIQQNMDIIQNALQKISNKIFRLDLQNYAIFIRLILRYLPNDELIYDSCVLMFQKYLFDNTIEGKTYFNRPLKLSYAFLHSLNVLLQLGQLHQNKGLKDIREKIDEIYKQDQLQKNNQKIIFLTTMARIMDKSDIQKYQQYQKDISNNIKTINFDKVTIIDLEAMLDQQQTAEIKDIQLMQQILDKYCESIIKKKNFQIIHAQSYVRLSTILSKLQKYLNITKFQEISQLIYLQVKDLLNEFQFVSLFISFVKLNIAEKEMFQQVQKLNIDKLYLSLILQLSKVLQHNLLAFFDENFVIKLINQIENQIADIEGQQAIGLKICIDNVQLQLKGKIQKYEQIQRVYNQNNFEFKGF